MSSIYHTPIPYNTIADDDTFNDPMGQLDLAIDDHWTFTSAHETELVAARGSYASLDARLDVIEDISIVAGGDVVTTANGAASAGQKTVTVVSTSGFVAGASVEYLLNGTTLEYNTIDVVTDATHLLLDNNIGTGGIQSGGLVALISTGIPMAANAIPHGSSDLTLPRAMEYVNEGVFNVAAYGASTSATGAVNSAAFQAAIDAAEAAGKGMVVLPAGAYALSTGLTLTSPNVHFAGYGATITCAAGQSFLTLGGSIYAGSVRGFTVVVSGGGHGIELSTCYLSNFEFRDLVIYTSDTGSGYYQPDGSTAANVNWCNCSFEVDVDASASPFWVLDASGGSFNSCSLQHLWFQLNKNDNVPAISIVSATNNYLYGISMSDLVIEQSHGGAICLKGAWGATLKNCLVYDLDVAISTTADMFEIGKHASGLASRGTTLINCGVIGNYTPGAFYGIDFTNGGLGSTLINCNATDTVDFNINANFEAIVLINCNLPVVNASDWDIQFTPAAYAVKMPIKSDTGDPTAQEGMIYVNKFDNKLRLYIDGAWKDVLAW